MVNIPTFSADLIEQLAKNEPDLEIKPDMSKDVIMYRSGRWSIINELVVRLQRSEADNDNKKTVKIKGD